MSDRRDREGTRRLDLGSYRGELAAEYNDPLLIEAISRPEELWTRPDAALLLDKRNRVGSVRIVLSTGLIQDIVIKEFPSRGIIRLKSLLQPSKAVKAWRGAMALKDRGLGTASPAAYLEKRRHGFVERSFFFAARIDTAQEIRDLFRRLRPAELGPLLSGLAGFLSQCHDRGILHRDLSDGNVLVKTNDSGQAVFFLLDTNRVRIRRKLRAFRRTRNLIRLGIPPGFQKYFLGSYFGEKTPHKAHWVWYRINKGVFAGFVGLKRMLRLRQIARFLRVQ